MTQSPALRPALALLLVSGACATAPNPRVTVTRDPYEGFNRKVYSVNRALDRAIIRPVAVGYTRAVPEAGRRGVTNFFNNITEPRTMVNAILQGKPKVFARSLGRFVINTVLGVGGLADHASQTFKIAPQTEDFGQTFAVWGIRSGPYLMLPFLGPSTLRDAAGRGVEFAGGDPYRFGLGRLNLRYYIDLPVNGVQILDTRAQLLDTADRLLNGSADEYATIRSAYLQSRRNDIYDGAPPEEEDDFVPEPAATPTTGPPLGTGAAPAAPTPPTSAALTPTTAAATLPLATDCASTARVAAATTCG